MSRRLVAAFCVVASVSFATIAHADDSSSPPPPSDAERIELRIVNGRRVYRLPGLVVPGERQAPYVFTLPGRGPLGYTPAPATHSDAARVVEAVRHAPF